jgi:hypothetical protein
MQRLTIIIVDNIWLSYANMRFKLLQIATIVNNFNAAKLREIIE